MIMDHCRVARKCYMRLWADSDELTLVRWFRAAPDAKLYEGPHRFYDRNWNGRDRWAGVGEVWPKRIRWDAGQNIPFYAGQKKCGPDHAFEFGGVHGVDPVIVTNADGTCACCGTPSGIHDPISTRAQPRARWPNALVGRAVAKPIASFQVSGIRSPVRSVASAAGIQFVPNALRGSCPAVALPAAQLRAGLVSLGHVAGVGLPLGRQGAANVITAATRAEGRGSARQGGSNGQRGLARSVAGVAGSQGPPPYVDEGIKSITRLIGRFGRGYVIDESIRSVAIPVAVWSGGLIQAEPVPCVALPVAVMRAGTTYAEPVPCVALPVAVMQAGRKIVGLASSKGKGNGTQGGSSTSIGLVAQTSSTGTNSLVITKPTGTASGDLIVIAAAFDGSPVFATITAPSGFTTVINTSGGIGLPLLVCYKVAGGSEPSSYTVTFSGSSTSAGIAQTWSPYTAIVTGTANFGTASPATALGVTLTGGSGVALAFFGTRTVSITTGPSGWTARATAGGATPKVYSYSKAIPAGASGNAAATLSAGNNWTATQVAAR